MSRNIFGRQIDAETVSHYDSDDKPTRKDGLDIETEPWARLNVKDRLSRYRIPIPNIMITLPLDRQIFIMGILYW